MERNQPPSESYTQQEAEASGLFAVEIAFTGLGVVLLDSGGERHKSNPTAVEFLLLRVPPSDTQNADSAHHHSEKVLLENGPSHHHEPHLPRLWFRLDDLAGPNDVRFQMTAGTDGMPLASEEISGTITIEVDEVAVAEAGGPDFEVQWATDGRESTSPNELDLDRIPDLEEHFGLTDIHLPDSPNAQNVYAARVKLPPGRIVSRRLLLNPDGSPAEWTFSNGMEEPVKLGALADQVVWSRQDVKMLRINDVAGGLVFDSLARESHGEPPLITLAITNLPKTALSGRVLSPEHFALLKNLASTTSATLREIQRDPPLPPAPSGEPITTGGACPPARKET